VDVIKRYGGLGDPESLAVALKLAHRRNDWPLVLELASRYIGAGCSSSELLRALEHYLDILLGPVTKASSADVVWLPKEARSGRGGRFAGDEVMMKDDLTDVTVQAHKVALRRPGLWGTNDGELELIDPPSQATREELGTLANLLVRIPPPGPVELCGLCRGDEASSHVCMCRGTGAQAAPGHPIQMLIKCQVARSYNSVLPWWVHIQVMLNREHRARGVQWILSGSNILECVSMKGGAKRVYGSIVVPRGQLFNGHVW
jgi:hypothetical protein